MKFQYASHPSLDFVYKMQISDFPEFWLETRSTTTVQLDSVPLRSFRLLTGRCRATAAL